MANRTLGRTTPSLRRAHEMAPTVNLPGIRLWAGWVAANALALLIAAAVSGAAVWGVTKILLGGEQIQMVQLLVAALAIVALGTTITGVMLGIAQFRVLGRVFWLMRRSEWLAPTTLGFGLLWLIGAILLTIRVLIDNTVLGERMIMPDLTRIPAPWLGAAVGVVVGAIIGSGQRPVLKRYIRGAHWWIPGHIIGWSLGLAVAFMARDALLSGRPPTQAAPVALGWLALGAVIVAAVNGFVLVWLARRRAELAAYQ